MTNAELLKLHPQHLAELNSFFAGFNFTNVDIVAKEIVTPLSHVTDEPLTHEFAYQLKSLKFDGVFRGESHMHAIFTRDEDNVFYCISYARFDNIEERIIFKLTFAKGDTE